MAAARTERIASPARRGLRAFAAALCYTVCYTLPACEEQADRGIRIYAAASLRDAVTELAQHFGKIEGQAPLLNFGGSGRLAMQIQQGGRADVFLSAGVAEMDALERLELIVESSRTPLLRNQLVVVLPSDQDRTITGALDLDAPWLRRLSIANTRAVPAGRYAREWLERAGAWDKLRERTLPAIDVRAALAAVRHGGAEAGIVYRTDADPGDDGIRIAHEVPASDAPTISYPIAVLRDSNRSATAHRFVEFLRSPRAREAFERHGFRMHQLD